MSASLTENQPRPAKRGQFRWWLACLVFWPILILVAFQMGAPLGRYLFLCYLYGFARVHGEGLHFSTMPKGHPWTVSNGDQIATNIQAAEFFISLGCAMLLAVVTGFLWRLFMKGLFRRLASHKARDAQRT